MCRFEGLAGRQNYCYFADRCLPVTIFHFISSTAQNRRQIPLRGKQKTTRRLRMEPGSSRNPAFPSGSTGPSPSAELLPQLLPPEPCTLCIAAVLPMSLSSVLVLCPCPCPCPCPCMDAQIAAAAVFRRKGLWEQRAWQEGLVHPAQDLDQPQTFGKEVLNLAKKLQVLPHFCLD